MEDDIITIRHMARARPECSGSNTRCSSAADRIIVRFLCRTLALLLYSLPVSYPSVFSFLFSCFFSNFLFHRSCSSVRVAAIPYQASVIFVCSFSVNSLRQGTSRDKLLASRTGAPEARNSRDPEHVACALSQRHRKILRATYTSSLRVHSWRNPYNTNIKSVTR